MSVFNLFIVGLVDPKSRFMLINSESFKFILLVTICKKLNEKKRKQRNKYFHKCVRLFHTIYNIIIIKNVLFVNITKTYYKGTEKSIYINGGGGGGCTSIQTCQHWASIHINIT